MREYGKLAVAFWERGSGKRLRGDHEATVIALYLPTCHWANSLGVFYVPLSSIAYHAGSPLEGATEALARVIDAGFCDYDLASELVWIPNHAEIEVGKELKPKDNRKQHIQEMLEALGNHPFALAFWEKYGTAFGLDKPKPLGSPFAGSWTPLRSQKQIQSKAKAIQGITAENEKSKTPSAPVAAAPGYRELVALWFAEYEKYYQEKPSWSPVHGRKLKEAMAQATVAELSTLIPHFFAWQRPEVIKGGHSLWKGYASFIAKLDELRADIAKPQRRAIAAVATDRERIDDSQAQNAAQSQRVLRALEEKRNAIGNGQGRADLGSGAHARGDLQPPAIGLGVDGVDGRALAPARAGADAVAQGRVPPTPHAGPGRHHRDDAGGEEA